ncbi:hypothetical protein O9929_09445 [Vibrio lentus]|nr:hypothetical protein [Vibrio lentus]
MKEEKEKQKETEEEFKSVVDRTQAYLGDRVKKRFVRHLKLATTLLLSLPMISRWALKWLNF